VENSVDDKQMSNPRKTTRKHRKRKNIIKDKKTPNTRKACNRTGLDHTEFILNSAWAATPELMHCTISSEELNAFGSSKCNPGKQIILTCLQDYQSTSITSVFLYQLPFNWRHCFFNWHWNQVLIDVTDDHNPGLFARETVHTLLNTHWWLP